MTRPLPPLPRFQDLHDLVRLTVQAKIAYWDLLRTLEQATAPDGDEWSDRANDEVINYLDGVAAAVDDVAAVDAGDVAEVRRRARL